VPVSTSAAPKAPAAAAQGRFYVQVGSFGVPANAEGARARLAGLGLPAAMGRGSIKGKAVQVVHAGPFATADQARAALNAARRVGFSDAFIR
jgi:cell division protein FtsN